MPTRLRKVRKFRGSRTHGWGQIGQHRKTGAKGGRGMAGGHKHKWTKLLKTDYFGQKGFVSLRRAEKNAVNLFRVSELAESTRSETLDLSKMGFDKLLGSGNISRPLTIIVSEWSKKAAERVERAGGKLVKPGELAAA
ncbi:MAG: uL15 family ribosomal protein [Candidatus Caldarchaeum sp.]|nr:uL15 family ribosomal protein [Candidatus Caldarchaeum sp.]